MFLPLSLLICLSVFQLCLGSQPENRLRRELHFLASWSEKPIESEDVQKAAKFAVENFNTKAKGKMLFKMVSIKSAKSKKSSKIKYKIDAVFERAKCPKWKNHDEKTCILEKEQLLCQFVVSLNPSNSKYSLKSKKCYKVKKSG
ncbi:cystatin-like isoform X1 [Gambusia affinis]|uniref:cystatin-like isoform X1 n=1 Tax=Gambusia affinis TaxID=33528 RepID=UPI001CDD52A0|nr:cystatin-like isoform X1 [Gambusia affinis]XP_043952343.1 cystatin-like isoform X1 [Gambusia affinis]